MDKIKLKDYFNRKIEMTFHFILDEYIDSTIRFIKDEYNIETNRHELLVDIREVSVYNSATRQKDKKKILSIKPSQELLWKFEKDYPEMII